MITMQTTPMHEQYLQIRKKYPDCILLFRLGDFYEAFDEDAKTVSKVLGITLTGRGKSENRIPMAGIPHHALKQYLPKLVKSGYKVALADQLEEPVAGKLVKRDVTKVITAGTLTDENLLTVYENNYLAVIHFNTKAKEWGLAFADVSTGEFKIAQYQSSGEPFPRKLLQELFRLRPAELIVSREQYLNVREYLAKFQVQNLPESDFDINRSKRILLEGFKVKSLKPFGIENYVSGIISAGVLYQYLLDTQKVELKHFENIKLLQDQDYMNLDEITIRSLELFYNLRGGEQNTLFECINNCFTPMGQRLLRSMLLRPLLKVDEISDRQDKISELIVKQDMVSKFRELLSEIIDTQRLLSRIATGSCNARDLLFLKNSMIKALELFKILESSRLQKNMELLPTKDSRLKVQEVIKTIEQAIKEDPPVTITDGNMIKVGYSLDLDKINDLSIDGRNYIRDLQEKERVRTGIQTLKVGFNQVFGYYVEVSKSQLSKIPENYIRKQTLVNAERYITEELKFWEEKVLSAQAKASEIEYEIFEKIRALVIDELRHINLISESIAHLDVYLNFAHIADKYNLVRPEIYDDQTAVTDIKNSRHLVVERSIKDEFIPNDIYFEPGETETIILTGPNMSGKSTYIRQVALIFILAQIGCFVPADHAKLVFTDRIFTRIGASDNLAAGESTFMVEMNETANILNNATSKSLIILDEIGRGTSTYDGLSIAWAIIEHLANNVKARTLFATHYHELVLLEEKLSGVKNYNVEVSDNRGEVIFMHKIIPGGTDRSYGIHVAKLSGIPKNIIARASDILKELENDQLNNFTLKSVDYQDQLTFGTIEVDDELRKEIETIDIDSITPIDALLKLKKLKEDISK